jgi:hypothetical protein
LADCDLITCSEVVMDSYVRRGRSRRCNLYSVGPSWGSACNLVTPYSESSPPRPDSTFELDEFLDFFNVPDSWGISQGEETLCGSVSKVNIDDAIILSFARLRNGENRDKGTLKSRDSMAYIR